MGSYSSAPRSQQVYISSYATFFQVIKDVMAYHMLTFILKRYIFQSICSTIR